MLMTCDAIQLLDHNSLHNHEIIDGQREQIIAGTQRVGVRGLRGQEIQIALDPKFGVVAESSESRLADSHR